MDAMEDRTELNTRINLWVAFDYGGRAELVEAARRLVESGVESAGHRRERLRREPVRADSARPRPADPDERRAARSRTSCSGRSRTRSSCSSTSSGRTSTSATCGRAAGVRVAPSTVRRLVERGERTASGRRYRLSTVPERVRLCHPSGSMSNWLSRIVVARRLPVVLGVVYLGGWWVFALARGRGADRAARVLAARTAARAARAGRLHRRRPGARRRRGRGHRLGGRRRARDASCSRSC